MQQQKIVQQQASIKGEVLKWGRCICGLCNNKGKFGSTTTPTQQNPVAIIMCYDCTVKDIADRRKISIKEAKDRHEKTNKAQEILAKIILERYKEETGKKIPKNMEGLAEIMRPGITWWQQSVSESEKDKVLALSKDEMKEYFKKAPVLPTSQQPIVNENQTGRNDPCPCGSGKKYKKCCLK